MFASYVAWNRCSVLSVGGMSMCSNGPFPLRSHMRFKPHHRSHGHPSNVQPNPMAKVGKSDKAISPT